MDGSKKQQQQHRSIYTQLQDMLDEAEDAAAAAVMAYQCDDCRKVHLLKVDHSQAFECNACNGFVLKKLRPATRKSDKFIPAT